MRSGRERCGSRIAVGRGGRGEDEQEAGGTRKAGAEEEEEEEARKEATLIKSNNPHLAGGEICIYVFLVKIICPHAHNIQLYI